MTKPRRRFYAYIEWRGVGFAIASNAPEIHAQQRQRIVFGAFCHPNP